MSALVWLPPTVAALFLYGFGQGFVKKFSPEVPPARFCLYFAAAKVIFDVCFYLSWPAPHPEIFDPAGREVLLVGLAAYVINGLGWILYYKSVEIGPITIVGTLSAAYPALTVLFARIFLGEALLPQQYAAVLLVIVGCVGLAYSPAEPGAKATSRAWIRSR